MPSVPWEGKLPVTTSTAKVLVTMATLWMSACGEVTTPSESADAATGDASEDAAPDLGLIARYSLDMPDGVAFRDDSGNGHDAACVGGCPPVGLGVFGSAASFGDGATLQVADDGSFVTPGGFAVSAWLSIRSLTAGVRAAVVSKPFGTGIANSWQIVIEGDGRPTFFSSITSNDSDFLTGANALPLAEFVHVAITWDGSVKRLFVAGELVGANAADLLFTMEPVVMGADVDNGNVAARFDGLIDEVQIFNRSLSDPEIAALAVPPGSR